ncbi:hypothetical protein AFK49_002310 [Corynebacterium ulcerans]|nr:hypothetical protein [Corynebacterium ulcerans]OAG69626.1 hypothetical protein AFK49_002310 [Corynebacterium ulcerans]
MIALLLVVLVVGGAVFFLSRGNKSNRQIESDNLQDSIAEARRWIERLGSQVLTISGTDAASTQAIADASERYNAASSQISTATTVRQAELARESALEGLHYMNAAREIMGLPAGPELPPLEGQRQAGKVTENRTIDFEGQQITASPHATPDTPNYYPGGMVAGRPVPAGWYSEPWWAGALRSGLWTAGSVFLFSSLFNGMSGVGYSAHAFESGFDKGYAEGLAANGGDGGGDIGDVGGDSGDDGGFFDGFFGGDGDNGGGFDFDFDF